MWLYTPQAAFSIITYPDKPFRRCVRARLAADLDWLRERYLPDLTDNVFTSKADYPYRAFAPSAKLATAVARIVLDIDYQNVKSATLKRSGRDRENVYHRVHSATLGLENIGKKTEPATDRRQSSLIEWFDPAPQSGVPAPEDIDDWLNADLMFDDDELIDAAVIAETKPLAQVAPNKSLAIAQLEADIAIESGREAANAEWLKAAYEIGLRLATHRTNFTSDDFHVHLDRLTVQTHDRRALGSVWRDLRRNGVIRAVPGAYRRSVRRRGAPLQVWERVP